MSHATIPLNERHSSAIPAYGARTDVGRMRDHNEDNYVAAPPLYAVADGMGGHEAGEVASKIAVTVLEQQAPTTLDANALSNAVVTANYAIMRAVEDGHGAEGMGCTLTAAMVKGERLLIAQVGDSRAYLLHQSHLQQITRDHSLMSLLIETGPITPEEAETHPQRCANQLIKRANMNGGNDNITAIVVDIEGNVPEQIRKHSRKSRFTVGIVAFLLLAVLGGACFGVYHWMTTSAYLAESNGHVAIYQGVAGGFFGINNSELVEETTINVDDLNAGLAQRLRGDGVKADNLDEARRLAQEYAEDAERNKSVSAGGEDASNAAGEAATATVTNVAIGSAGATGSTTAGSATAGAATTESEA